MKLAIGFISYNESSAPYLNYFLDSLAQALKYAKLQDSLVLAFDNSDSDYKDNREIIDNFKLKSGLNILQLKADNNVGFAFAYNLMIKEALSKGAEYFLVINPDIILNEDSLDLLIKKISQRSDLASVAPRIMSWDFKNLAKTEIIDSLGIGLKPVLNFFDIAQGELLEAKDEDLYRKKALEMIAPSGAAALYRLSSLVEIAEKGSEGDIYFDERFFMYKEDCDLAYRFQRANLKSKTVFESVFYHDRTTKSLGGGIKNFFLSRREKSKQARAWSFRNQHFIFLKYFKSQKLSAQLILVCKMLSLFIFSLIFEQFLLKEYRNIFRFNKH